VSVLDTHYLVAAVVDPFKVGWRQEIKGESQFVVRGIQLDQMLDGA
jgi:hypothetical protein